MNNQTVLVDANVSYTADKPPSPRPDQLILLYLLPVIVVTGSFGNVMSVLVLLRPRMRTTSVYFYLLALAGADTLVLYASAFKTWVRLMTDFELMHTSDAACKFIIFILLVAWYLSAWLVVLTTVDRFVAVWFPFKVATVSSMSRARLATVILVVVVVIFNGHVFWTMQLQESQYEPHHLQCVPGPVHSEFMRVPFEYLKLSTYSLLPFVIILALNVAIIARLRSSAFAVPDVRHRLRENNRNLQMEARGSFGVTRSRDVTLGDEATSGCLEQDYYYCDENDVVRCGKRSRENGHVVTIEKTFNKLNIEDANVGPVIVIGHLPQCSDSSLCNPKDTVTGPNKKPILEKNEKNLSLTTHNSTTRSEFDQHDNYGVRPRNGVTGSCYTENDKDVIGSIDKKNSAEAADLDATTLQSDSKTMLLNGNPELMSSTGRKVLNVEGKDNERNASESNDSSEEMQRQPESRRSVSTVTLHLMTKSTTSGTRSVCASPGAAEGLNVTSGLATRVWSSGSGSGSTLQLRRQARVTSMLLVVSFSWLVLTIPWTIFGITMNGQDHSVQVKYIYVKVICFLLMYTNHAVNFYLYCISGRKFRRELVDLCWCWCKCARGSWMGWCSGGHWTAQGRGVGSAEARQQAGTTVRIRTSTFPSYAKPVQQSAHPTNLCR